MKYFLSIFFLSVLPYCLSAQQQSSKTKSADKIYEKGGIRLSNASGINTGSHEFSPTFYQNGLVYVSFHKAGPIDEKTGKPFFELFFAETDEFGLPQNKPREFSLSINSQVHEGPVTFSRDFNTMYFTRNNLEGGIPKANAKKQVPMKIYEARRGKFDWENIQELPFNSNEYTCFHPALSKDGNRLFFASDMPGGYGGYDLYYVEKKADTWSKPVNLGADINTTGNEVFPFLHESGTLFFSSNGHNGSGSLDIFSIDISGNDWGELNNLGSPFNSAKDDLGFILNEEGTRGYFSSDRPDGSGEDDIYMFESAVPIINSEAAMLSAMIVAYDARTNERIPNAGIRIFQRTEDGFVEGNNFYDVQTLPGNNGELVLKLQRKNEGELPEPTIFTSVSGEALASMRQDKSYVVLVTKDGYESAEVVHSTLGETGAQTIRVPMNSRSCAALGGLVTVNGYQNGVPNALVRIVNETQGTEQTLRSGASGQFEYCLVPECEYTVYAEKEGYENGMAKVSTLGSGYDEKSVTLRLKPLNNEIVKEPIKEGSIIVLENIYYDFNQYIIRSGAARDLDALAQLMKQFPSMNIELIAHTDSRGTEVYNQDLSLKRAESARRYLIQKGIQAYRIEAFGYGESQIRNRCKEGVECSEEEHQYNRRTEVKVVKIDEPVKVEYQEGTPIENGGN
jgi:outer membrane protein OmpA-like peptidoglycan-associated protein